MEDHSVAGALEQSAKLLLRFAQGAFGEFTLRVVDNAGADEILAFRGQAQQTDFGGDEAAIGLLVEPFENRNTPGQDFIGLFAGKLTGALAAGLILRTDIRRR